MEAGRKMLISDVIMDDYDFRVVNTCFPHIGRKIAAAWGQAEFTPVIHCLLRDTRKS